MKQKFRNSAPKPAKSTKLNLAAKKVVAIKTKIKISASKCQMIL